MSIYLNRSKIDEMIRIIRRKMIASAWEKGFSHPDTVKLSQELDRLINKLLCSKE